MKKHSVLIHGHATSISMEPEFWHALDVIAKEQNISRSVLITRIDDTRNTNLSSALRVFILSHFLK